MKAKKLIISFFCMMIICPLIAFNVAADEVFHDNLPTNTPPPEISTYTSSEISSELVDTSTEIYNNFISVDPELFLYTEEGIGYLSWWGAPTADEMQYLKNKAAEITDGCVNATEKIYAVMKYISLNICYDYDYLEHNTKEYPYLDPYDILINGSTICEGYARTTATLLQLVDVPCIYVDSPNHKWNMAYNGERWILFDTTWIASGKLEYGVLNKSDKLNFAWYDFNISTANDNENHIIESLDLTICNRKLVSYPKYTSLKNIVIPASVKSIYDRVSFPSNIDVLRIPESVTSFGEYVLNGKVNKIIYEGSKSEYQKISIDSYNTGITNCRNIVYEDNAATPYFLYQPTDAMNNTVCYSCRAVDDYSWILCDVECSNSQLTYQWYQNDTMSNIGGTPVDGVGNDSAYYEFTHNEEGVTYLYVEVTSIDNSVSGNKEVVIKSNPICVETFKANPTVVSRVGMDARIVCYKDIDEVHFIGSGVVEDSSFWDESSAVYISKGISYIPDYHCDRTLKYTKNIWVEDGNEFYESDEYGVLYDKVNKSLVRFPYYLEVVEYSILDGTKSVDLSKIDNRKDTLETLHIPSSVDKATGFLKYMWGLKEITVGEGNSNYYVDEYGALIDKAEHRLIKLPNAAANDKYIMPDDIETIAPYAFTGYYLNEIELSDSLKTIENYAFYNCTAIKRLFIPVTVEKIGDYAFAYYQYLTDIYFYGDIPEIGEKIFDKSGKLELPIIHYAVGTNWPSPTWTDANGNTYNTVPFDPEIVGKSNCCGDNAWWELNEGVLTIYGKGEIWNYEYLKSPWYVQCSNEAGICSDITGIVVSDGITRIGDYCFTYLNYVTDNVVLPRSLKSIGRKAFYLCYQIPEIYVLGNVEEIEDHAFMSCNTLESIYFYGDAPTDFGSDVFLGAHNDFTIYYIDGKSGWTTPTWNGYKTAKFVKTADPYITGAITSYGDADAEVTVTLYDANKTVVDSCTTTSGTYTLSAPAGTYTLEVSKTMHASREYAVTVGTEDITKDVEIWLYGDVYHGDDNMVTIIDASQIQRYVLGKKSVFGSTSDTELEAYRLKVADVYTNDGDVTIIDASQIQRYVMGKSSIFNYLP